MSHLPLFSLAELMPLYYQLSRLFIGHRHCLTFIDIYLLSPFTRRDDDTLRHAFYCCRDAFDDIDMAITLPP